VGQSRLLVLVVAEQFRSDYLDHAARGMVPGGFRRLMEEACFYPDCRHLASTFTATGLATLATGAYPEVHGIIADTWYDRAAAAPVRARLETMEATTLADQMAGRARQRIFGLSLEETHSFLVGRSPHSVFFMDGKGQFVARGGEMAWLDGFQRLRPLEDLRGARWVGLGAPPETPPLRTLTWDPKKPEEFYSLYKSSPFAQATQFELLRELIVRERLGQGDTFDYVAVSVGSPALLGYEVGAESPLMEQMVLHLDRQIEATLALLNKTPGAGNYLLVFTAAHGAPAEPPGTQRPRLAIAGDAIARAVNGKLTARFDPSTGTRFVERYVYPFLYLRRPPRADEPELKRLRSAAGAVALETPGVSGYFTADGESSHHGAWQQRFRNSFHAGRSGDLMLAYRPGAVEEFGAGRGISYGSLYNYDARVPLFLYGPPFRPRVIERTIEAVDVAPTLARVIGTALPSSSTGRVLTEALAGTRTP
jgi:hypothetical protein